MLRTLRPRKHKKAVWLWQRTHPRNMLLLNRCSHGWLFATIWTIARQAPLSMGFSKQENWSGSPCSSPGDLPHSGIKPASLASPALASRFFATSATWEASSQVWWLVIPDIPWLMDTSFQSLPVFPWPSSLCLWICFPFSFLLRTCHWV